MSQTNSAAPAAAQAAPAATAQEAATFGTSLFSRHLTARLLVLDQLVR